VKTSLAALLAELLGTFTLVLAGAGAIVINTNVLDKAGHGVIGHVGIALTFGLVIGAMVFTFGGISGCHINPAVTCAMLLRNKIDVGSAIAYIISQCLGATAAAAVLRFLFPDSPTLGETMPAGPDWQSLVLEGLCTFFLVMTIFRVTSKADTRPFAGIAIGAVIGLDALFAGPISGASMNPARSLGPALVAVKFDHLWLYILGPITGALLAATIDRIFFHEKPAA
jgi:aquaporin Z